MTERAQLKHLLIDVEFFGKPKIRALAIDQGQLAVLLLVRIYAALSAATDAKARKSVAISIGLEMRFDPSQVETFLTYCFEERLLEQDGNYITARRVVEDQEEFARKQKKWRADYERKKSGIPAESERNRSGAAAESQQIREDLKDLKNIKEKLSAVPEPLQSELIAEIPLWIEHREAKRKPLGFTEIDALIMECARNPESELRSMRASRKNGHATLYAVADGDSRSKSHPKSNHYDAVIALVRKHGRNGWEEAQKVLPAEILPAVRAVGWRTFCDARDGDPQLKNRFFEALK
jgi:hypothetical protein